MLKSTPKCPKFTLEVPNSFNFKVQNAKVLDLGHNQMAKKLPALQKKAQNRPVGN
jgi:hypothetical protein